MQCTTNVPLPYLFSPKRNSQVKQAECWQKIKFAEWQEIRAHPNSSLFHRSAADEAQLKPKRRIQMIVYSQLRRESSTWAGRKTTKASVSALNFFLRFLLNFLSHVQSMGGLIRMKPCFYFGGMGGRSRCIDWLSVQPERDAVKRIMHKDFTIFFGANGITTTRACAHPPEADIIWCINRIMLRY